MTKSRQFPRPDEVPVPSGAEDWRSLYNWYHVFDGQPGPDADGFWFQDALHHPDVMRPYDEIQCECWWQALGAFNTRIFAVPPAFGVDQRILNGYLYVTPVPAPQEDIEARAELFAERASHYYDNWDDIYAEWKTKVVVCLDRIKATSFAPLPVVEDASVVTEHTGVSSGYRMIADYDQLVLTMYETYQYHFEFLNIGYAAYLTFFEFVRAQFPDIEEQSIATMVSGLWVDLYRPDDEMKRLAKLAVSLDIDDQIAAQTVPEALFTQLRASAAGGEWVADWEATADPWFMINTDSGHPGGYSGSRTLFEQPELALDAIRSYAAQLRRGETVDRPTAEIIANRDRVSDGYRGLLADEVVPQFDALLALARKVFVYIEEHVLYIEHWMWAAFWGKSRELAATLTEMGVLDEAEDMFYLRRYEVMETLYDAVATWSVGSARGRSADHWRPIVAKRRAIVAALETQPMPPALGRPPEAVTEPLTQMLWGITTQSVEQWLDGDAGGNVITGKAGSPGVVVGPARVVTDVAGLADVADGDILVCPATSPAWSPVFARLGATVSDIGGIMSHTAIVCREYGLPAVVGTQNACRRIKTGQLIRVDGTAGTVTILEGDAG